MAALETPGRPADTPEQTEIKLIRTGFHVVSANAGTGKTHTLAELILQLYLEEERKLYPGIGYGKHVGGEEQLAILRQIQPITFTRDAARELDERISALMAAEGISAPNDRFGRKFRLCRTIDSLVHGWLRRGMVIQRLLRVDPDIAGSMREKLGMFSSETRAHFEEGGQPLVKVFKNWPWLRDDSICEMIFDVCHRSDTDPIEGLSLEDWQARFASYLRDLPPAPKERAGPEQPAWAADFWEPMVAKWKAYQTEERELARKFERGEVTAALLGLEVYQRKLIQLKAWEANQAARKEFFEVLEIARSRGYHPVRSPDQLASLAVLQELAASDHWRDFLHFHQAALFFYAQKLRFCVMDHADFLIACVDTFEANPDLLERDREYPRLGIRAKHVLYDEVQDNSVSNNRLFRVLCARRGVPYLGLAVGDAKQAIYGFRGACSYGFASMIDAVKKREPENLHHLTCSFRSLARIVALGNECVMTLPSYKASVHPSHTVYPDAGDIVLAPPMRTESEEQAWVMQRVWDLLYQGTDTVMVLHRNNLNDHPIYDSVVAMAKDFPGRFSHYTIHRSKGLQAHHVFLMGMTATLMPDIRTSYTQTVNLLYVALTRPRKALYITAPTTIERTNSEGLVERKDVGPSPFIYNLPTLLNLAQKSGWSLEDLKKGETTTKAAAGMLAARVGGKEGALRAQWRQLWPHVEIRYGEGEEPTDETGSAAPSPSVRLIRRRSLYEGGVLMVDSGPRLDEGLKRRVADKLRTAWLKNGNVPRMTRDEEVVALRSGWIEKREGRAPTITAKFTVENGCPAPGIR